MDEDMTAFDGYVAGSVGITEHMRNVACDVYRDIGELDSKVLRWWLSNDTNDEDMLYLREELDNLRTEADALAISLGSLWSFLWDSEDPEGTDLERKEG